MEQEFTQLLHENQGILHKVCKLYFGERPNAEDYRQELVIQLWKAFPKFTGQAKFSTWMYRVCLNAAIDLLRKEKLQPQWVSHELSGIAESDNSSSENTLQAKLYRAIQQLSATDKAIITLYLDEYTYQEIADIVGISANYTGVKIKRIKDEIIKSINHGK